MIVVIVLLKSNSKKVPDRKSNRLSNRLIYLAIYYVKH
jgi:hypothetical protein